MITTTDRRAALDLVRAVHVDDDQATAELLDHRPADVALAVVEHLLLLAFETDTDVEVWLDGLVLDLANDQHTVEAHA